MKRSKLLLMAAVGMLFVASQALAVPIPNGAATYQQWTFDDNDNPAIPEIDLNPFGTAVATMDGSAAGPPPEWAAELLGRTGVWKADGMIGITLDVPNQMIRNPYKVIYLEVGFLGDPTNPAAFSVFPSPFGGTVQLVSQEVVVDPTTGWNTLFAEWYIEPNPDSESICYSFSGDIAAVDYVDVHTICVPEPLTIGLLGIGGLMLRRRRKA